MRKGLASLARDTAKVGESAKSEQFHTVPQSETAGPVDSAIRTPDVDAAIFFPTPAWTAKNSVKTRPHGSRQHAAGDHALMIQPESASNSKRLHTAPPFGSIAPKTTRGMRDCKIAPAHITQAPSVTYSVARSRRQSDDRRGRLGDRNHLGVGGRIAERSLAGSPPPRSARRRGRSPPQPELHPHVAASIACSNARAIQWASASEQWIWTHRPFRCSSDSLPG